jgi:hypothetical protein
MCGIGRLLLVEVLVRRPRIDTPLIRTVNALAAQRCASAAEADAHRFRSLGVG